MRKIFLSALLFAIRPAAAQQAGRHMDVQHYAFNIRLSDENDVIEGRAAITATFTESADSVVFDLAGLSGRGKGMVVGSVTADNNKRKPGKEDLAYRQTPQQLVIYSPVTRGSRHTYVIHYQGVPADGLIISRNKFGERTFFADNWANRAHQWIPCADYPSDKASVDFAVTAPSHYRVIANGVKIEEKVLPGQMKLTHYRETAPLPTKVMVIGAADFAVDRSGTVSGIPVSSWVFPAEKEKGFESYRYAPAILSYFIKQVGPFAYKKLANVQSKTIFGGMENAGAIFYYENSVDDPGIETLMAHEIAHQWFGDAVSEKDWSQVWLSEGFATYMADLYLESRYGTDSLKNLLRKQRKKVIAFSKQRTAPVIDSVSSDYTRILNPNSYEKGAWVLHMLRRNLGDKIFWSAVRNYYKRYKNKNAGTDDLRRVFEQVSGKELKPFFEQWLYRSGQPVLKIVWKYEAADKVVKLQVAQEQPVPFQFPLEYKLPGDKIVHQVFIKDKDTRIDIPASSEPAAVLIDPDVNLLAEMEIVEAGG